MRVFRTAALSIAMLMLAVSAFAQTDAADASAAPAADQSHSSGKPRQPIGVRAFGLFDVNSLTASQSFTAVLGTSRLNAFGGGVDVTDISAHVFVRVAGSHMSKVGSRAFADKTGTSVQVVSLNVPTTVALTPLEIGVGWRFVMTDRAKKPRPLTPYAGLSVLSQHYSDTSSFAAASDNVSQTNRGVSLFGGIDLTIMKHISLGLEGQLRSVPKAIGTAGVSQVFGETDLGGKTLRLAFGVKF